ncbi:MAG: hypothetical protein H7831_11450 [Magnetococcus sp. WYHC-3]
MAETNQVLPRLGIYGLTGCAGDQLAILNAEEALLEVVSGIDLVSFAMASSSERDDPVDIALVEGSVCSVADVQRLREVRGRARILVALGTCAVWGGIPAMVSHLPLEQLKLEVYGRVDVLPDAREAMPLSHFVDVDYAIPGCPVELGEVLETLRVLLAGGRPRRMDYSVCSECRMAEQVCLVQSRGVVCCGPITMGGCKARCVAFRQPCHGCRGPVDDPAWEATARVFSERGMTKAQVIESIKRYSAPAWVARHLAPRFREDPLRQGRHPVSGGEGTS